MLEKITQYYDYLFKLMSEYVYSIGQSLERIVDVFVANFQLSVFIAGIALYLAFRNYRRKSGVLIYGGALVSNDYLSSQPYVSDLILENQKDRAVTIYGIYLKIGHNYYLEIEDLEANPLMLKPYESLRKSYTRAYAYSASTDLVSLRGLLGDRNIKRRVALSTAAGRYIVPPRVKRWDPIVDSFHNMLTVTVRPWQIEYNGISLGDNVRYCLDVTSGSGNQTVLVTGSDLTSALYGIRFPKSVLESVAMLEDFLDKKRQEGVIPPGVNIHITTIEEIIGNQLSSFPNRKSMDLPYYNFIFYKFVGRALSLWQSIEIRFSNAALRRKRKRNRNR